MVIQTATVVALSVSGWCLSGTEWKPNKVEGSMCFTYKQSYVFTPNTESSLAMPGLGVTAVLLSTQDTSVHISLRYILNKHIANVNNSGLREKQANWCRVARRSAALPLGLVCSAASLLGSWLPLVFFFCLIWSKDWLSKRERQTASESEEGGVVYCFWRKRCRVTCCS